MTDEPADAGTYTLLVEIPEEISVGVGALGELTFEAGWYAYTGSAFGPGGFARVERHRELAAGEREARHWHVDYLLGAAAGVDTVVRSPGADVECAVAGTIGGTRIPEFGASDCDCESHLTYAPERSPLLAAIRDAHRTHAPGEVILDE